MKKCILYVCSAIEDLAFTSHSSRAAIWGYPHIVGDVVLSTTLRIRDAGNHGNRG